MTAVIDTNVQASLIRLVIAWALVGAFVFTLIVTCLSLIRPNTIPEKAVRKRLFTSLIVELIVICLGFFTNFLTFAPGQVQDDIRTKTLSEKEGATPTPASTPTAKPLLTATPSLTATPATTTPPITERTIVVKVITTHVGGDDHKSDTFTFEAPAGYTIKDYKLLEHAKGGDAGYSSEIKGRTLQVKWHVKSRTVRGPLHVLLNTITAFLDLDAQITLEASNDNQ